MGVLNESPSVSELHLDVQMESSLVWHLLHKAGAGRAWGVDRAELAVAWWLGGLVIWVLAHEAA